ncbi:hypothetical protein, partial [Jatrophihabitans endophyticus]|uniref:hypothetical protein n=1 Tax=Jatrophihabitans endophyticus TaxID=1206085 RepID=UPI0019FE324D
MSSLALADSSLRTSYGNLYAFAERGRGTALVRLDPSTGRVAARRTGVLDDPSAVPAPAFAGGLVWVISERHGAREVRLDGVDPDTLELRRHLVVRTRDPVMVRGTDDLDGGDRVDGSALVLAYDRHIELYRPTVRRTQRVTAPATVHDV